MVGSTTLEGVVLLKRPFFYRILFYTLNFVLSISFLIPSTSSFCIAWGCFFTEVEKIFPMGRTVASFLFFRRAILLTLLMGLATLSKAQLTLVYSTTDVSCHGGTNGIATVVAFGGAAPYTYQWSTGATTPTISNLAAGTYVVTVVDNNQLQATTEVIILEPVALTVTLFSTYQICDVMPDGTAGAQPNGGVPPYSYLWSTGATTDNITGLVEGTYSITVTDANNCTTEGTVDVTAFTSEGIWIGDSTIHITCFEANDGMAIAMPMSGTGPYLYAWSNGDTTMKVTNLAPGPYTVTVTDVNGCAGTLTFLVEEPTELTTTVGVTPASCAATGSVVVTPNGGTGPYNIEWGNGLTDFTITGLAPGTYTATVTDANGCEEEVTVTVTGTGSSLTVNGTVVAPAGCTINGSGLISVVSGSGTYTYSWSDGQTTAQAVNLPAGTYTVTVTDVANSCTGVGIVVIPSITAVEVTAIPLANASCNTGGVAFAQVTVGIAPFVYEWSNGQQGPTATGLLPGDYSVTVTDTTGCVGVANVQITQIPLPVTITQVISNATCSAGGSAQVVASSGQPPYTYTWSNGASTATVSGLLVGTYFVTVTDSLGCTRTDSVIILQTPAPVLNPIVLSSAGCLGGGSASAGVAGGLAPFTYVWSNGETTATAVNLPPGTATVTVRDANGCEVSASVQISPPTQPSASVAIIQPADCNNGATIVAIPAGGLAPYHFAWSTGDSTATVSNVPPGVYSLTVTDANSCSTVVPTIFIQATGNIKLGDFVWYDVDQNGIQSGVELGLGVAGVVVNLTTEGADGSFGTSDDVVVATTITGPTGHYLFDCVEPGTYVIVFSNLPTGYQFTFKDVGQNECLDSDADLMGATDPFTVVAGQSNNICIDAGIHMECEPLLFPGTICCNQTICFGETPNRIQEVAPPVGGEGALEYLWMEFKKQSQGPATWVEIPGATERDLQTGPLRETSYFMRRCRRVGCERYIESNIITVAVLPIGSSTCNSFAQDLSLKALGPSSVEVSWETGLEAEAFTYTVQHSKDGSNWMDLAEMNAYYNGNEVNRYQYLDRMPSPGINFYRIQRSAPDGAQATSVDRYIELRMGDEELVSVYPNPARSVLYVKNLIKSEQEGVITITSSTGALVTSLVVPAIATQVQEIDLRGLPAGLYYVHVRLGNGTSTVTKISKL